MLKYSLLIKGLADDIYILMTFIFYIFYVDTHSIFFFLFPFLLIVNKASGMVQDDAQTDVPCSAAAGKPLAH